MLEFPSLSLSLSHPFHECVVLSTPPRTLTSPHFTHVGTGLLERGQQPDPHEEGAFEHEGAGLRARRAARAVDEEGARQRVGRRD